MNDELTYSVILNVVFQKSKLKSMKNVQMRKRVYVFFLRRGSRQLTDFCYSEQQKKMLGFWGFSSFGLQRNFDIDMAFLFYLVWLFCMCLSPVIIEYNFKCAG